MNNIFEKISVTVMLLKILGIYFFCYLATNEKIAITHLWHAKVKVGVLRLVQQPGSYWDRFSELPLVGLEPTEVTAYD